MSRQDEIPDLPPPSYEDALNQTVNNTGGTSNSVPPSMPPRPNDSKTGGFGGTSGTGGTEGVGSSGPILVGTSTTTSSSSSYQTYGSSSNSSRPPKPTPDQDIYTNNGQLPFKFPKGFLCSKCKNTGYKKNGEMCRRCWNTYYLDKHAYNPNPKLPFKYPRGFLCEKCDNTGTKRKNGKTCKDCWLRFAGSNTSSTVSYSSYNPFPLFSNATTLTQVGGPGMAQRVAPGDPRIGGTLCGRCRGSGITHFFLDEEICPVCNGLGRVLPKQAPQQWSQPQQFPQYPPQQQYQPQGYPQQGYPPQGYPPQGYPPQGYPPQGYPPQGYPQQQEQGSYGPPAGYPYKN